MQLVPPLLEISDLEGFTPDNDLFGLEPFGERLANLVCGLDRPLVIALDEPWGSGKTVFAKQWAGLLRQREVPVIYFDAFANDFHEDAFTALASELTAYVQALPGRKKEARSFAAKAKSVAKVLLPMTAKISIAAATAGILSSAAATEATEGVKAAIKATGDTLSNVTDKLVAERVERANADRAAMEAFRSGLQDLSTALAKPRGGGEDESDSPPLVVIVDEMDRCRPVFALNLLERIKHLFAVRGVVFVLITHLEQLARAVRGAYGDIEAEIYLEKFIHLKLNLVREPGGAPVTEKYVHRLWQLQQLKHSKSEQEELVKQGVVQLALVHDLGLRTIERVVTNVALVLAAAGPRRYFAAAIPVVLCFMRVLRNDLFLKAAAGTLTWPEVETFLRLDQWGDYNANPDWYQKYWRFVCEALSDEEAGAFGDAFARYNFGSGTDILVYFAGMVTGLQQIGSDG